MIAAVRHPFFCVERFFAHTYVRFCVFLYSATWGEGVVTARGFACASFGFVGAFRNGVWSGEVGENAG